MKALRALLLVLAISVCVYAGEIPCDRTGEMRNDVAGVMDNGKAGEMYTDVLTAMGAGSVEIRASINISAESQTEPAPVKSLDTE